MDFRFTPEQEKFQQEIKEFLKQELTPELRAAMASGEGGFGGVSKEFSRKLGQKGWIGLAWPKEYGGEGLSYIDRLIFSQEMCLSSAPRGYHHVAERQMGPSLIISGSEEQKEQFLSGIAAGEISFCIGYSEPGTGSDLAALETKAVADGDDYVINGSKIWNSAHHADWMWLATRTNPDVPKHKGISVFLLDLKTPGVTINPVKNMMGSDDFNLVTFDDVRIPKRMMVGEEDTGWYIVAGNLDFERADIERALSNYVLFNDFIAFTKEARFNGKTLWENTRVQHQLAQMAIEMEAAKLMCYKVAWAQEQGTVPNKEAATAKLFGTESNQRMARGMLQILGLYGQLDKSSGYAPLQGRVLQSWYRAFATTLAGGTSEIQRNVIATRGLGLPRG